LRSKTVSVRIAPPPSTAAKSRPKSVPPIMGVTLYGSFFIVLFSAIVDIVYVLLDPRIRPS
jgi:ABC-type dipeptide/oligopeptide/nickel transport system permease component